MTRTQRRLWALPLCASLLSTTALAQEVAAAGDPPQRAGENSPIGQLNYSPNGSSLGAPDAPHESEGSLFSDTRTTLFGDPGEIRSKLKDMGVSLGLQETSELWGNVTGGVKQGAVYDGFTLMGLGIDTGKAFGLEGGVFNASALQIHGRSISAENTYVLQTISGVEANRSTRLWELWYDQSFLRGALDLKIGQQSIDQEFLISNYANLFANAALGWPLVPSVNMYAGGPTYPLSSLGARLRGTPMDNLTLLGGVFDDNPPGGPFYDNSQTRGAEQSGTKFNTGTGALFIAEAQYATGQPDTGDIDRGETPFLPGLYKIGFWYDTGHFPDQRYGSDGLSLADLASNGDPAQRRGNYSLYGVMDQMVWRPGADSPQSLGVFGRIMGAPSNQGLSNFALNAGLVYKGAFGRDNDSIGLAYGLAKISDRAIGLDRDAIAVNGSGQERGSESFIELTYQAVIAPWLAVQPDFQYVFTPGGGITNPQDPGKRIGNEAIFGLRTSAIF